MSENHALFLRGSPITEFETQRYDWKGFTDKGISVAGWDTSQPLSSKELDNKIKNLPANTHAIFVHTYTPTAKKFIVYLQKHNIETSFIRFNEIPTCYPKVKYRIKEITPRHVTSRIIDTIYDMKYHPKPLKYIFYGADFYTSVPFPLGYKLIPAHSLDYSEYLRHYRDQIPKNEPYIVFIDQKQGDYDIEDKKLGLPQVYKSRSDYLVEMNTLFDKLEREYSKFIGVDIRIVIAEHPRIEGYNKNDFSGRNIVRGRTPELIRDCTAAATHNSTSISYAVIWRKPILLLSPPTNDRSFYGIYPECLSRYFNIPVIKSKIDITPDNLAKCIYVSKQNIYDEYKRRYLVHPDSQPIPLWDIVRNTIWGET